MEERSVEKTQILRYQVSLCNMCEVSRVFNRTLCSLHIKVLALLFQVSLQSPNFSPTCLPNTKELNLRSLEILGMSLCLSISFFFHLLLLSLDGTHASLH